MATATSALNVNSREATHSRQSRRTRREGTVPGVVYGGSLGPVPFSVDGRTLRAALAGSSAVIELSVDGGKSEPVVLKEAQRHPVRGEIMHIDLLRVDLSRKIEQAVPIELIDVEDSVGVRKGGVVEHLVREVHVSALPTDIPEAIQLSIKTVDSGASGTLALATVPAGVEIVDDLETTVVNIKVPRAARSKGGDAAAAGDAPAAAEASSDE